MDSFPAAKGEQEKKSNDCFLISAPFLLGMQVLRVLSLPTSRHHLAGSCRYQQQEKKNKQMETATNYGSWPRQRPRRSIRGGNGERLDDVFLPGQL